MSGEANPAIAVELSWHTLDPAERCTFEVVQLDIGAGMRCQLSDLERLHSGLIDTLLTTDEARKERRIPLPPGTFRTAVLMHQFFENLCVPQHAFVAPLTTLLHFVCVANKLDLMQTALAKSCMDQLAALDTRVPHKDALDIGVRHSDDRLVRIGAIGAAKAWRPNASVASMATLLSPKNTAACAPHWLPHASVALHIQPRLVKLLQTRELRRRKRAREEPINSEEGEDDEAREQEQTARHEEAETFLRACQDAFRLDLDGTTTHTLPTKPHNKKQRA